MTNTRAVSRTLVIAIAAAFAVPVLPVLTGSTPEADADRIRVRVGGSVNVRIGTPRVRYKRRYRRIYRPRRVYVGGFYTYRFAPPPPAYTSDCYAPTYYTRPSAPPPVAVRARATPRSPLPKLGIGLSAGRYETEAGDEADEVGVFARYRIADPLAIEVESSKTEHGDGARIDKRLGAALYLDFAPRNRWSPYVVGGLGVVNTDIGAADIDVDRNYGEVGAGLTWRLSDRFSLAGDIRVGKLVAEDLDDEANAVPLAVPGADLVLDDEEYSRAQLRGILYF